MIKVLRIVNRLALAAVALGLAWFSLSWLDVVIHNLSSVPHYGAFNLFSLLMSIK